MPEPGMECGMHTQDQEIKQEALFIAISHHAWSTIYDDNLNNATSKVSYSASPAEPANK